MDEPKACLTLATWTVGTLLDADCDAMIAIPGRSWSSCAKPQDQLTFRASAFRARSSQTAIP